MHIYGILVFFMHMFLTCNPHNFWTMCVYIYIYLFILYILTANLVLFLLTTCAAVSLLVVWWFSWQRALKVWTRNMLCNMFLFGFTHSCSSCVIFSISNCHALQPCNLSDWGACSGIWPYRLFWNYVSSWNGNFLKPCVILLFVLHSCSMLLSGKRNSCAALVFSAPGVGSKLK